MTDDLKKLAEAAKAPMDRLIYDGHDYLPAAKVVAQVEDLNRRILYLIRERDEAFHVVRETLWMAQRYATGRQSYAVGKYNDAAKLALKIGAVEANRDGVLWALDGGNTAGMSGLTEAEFKVASEYRDALSAAREEIERLRSVIQTVRAKGTRIEREANALQSVGASLEAKMRIKVCDEILSATLTKEPTDG